MNDMYVTYLQSKSYSEGNTIKNYIKYVNDALEFIGIAIRSYFNFLEKAGYIKENPAKNLSPLRVRECDVKQKPYIEAHYLRDMVNAAKNSRDKAIVLLFASTGLRVSELVNIRLEDYYNLSGENNRELTIVGKGNKIRKVYINDETKLAIDMYLIDRPRTEATNLFLSFQGGPIHRNNLGLTLKNLAKRVGYPQWQDICNHALRSAFATTKAEQGVPLTTIQGAMGHARLETTLLYIKRNQASINKAFKDMAF